MKRKAPNQQSTIDEYSSTVAGVVRFKRPFDPYQNPDEKYNHVVRVCVNFSYHALVKHCCKKLTESQEKNVSRSSKMGRLQNGAALRHRRKRRHFAFSSVVESQRFCQSIFKNLERIISSGHSPKIGQEWPIPAITASASMDSVNVRGNCQWANRQRTIKSRRCLIAFASAEMGEESGKVRGGGGWLFQVKNGDQAATPAVERIRQRIPGGESNCFVALHS